MNIAKIKQALIDERNSYGYDVKDTISAHINETDTNICSIRMVFGGSANNVYDIELTIENYKVIWVVTNVVGISLQSIDSMAKAIKACKSK